MEKVVSSTLAVLNKLYNKYPGFSLYFLEQTLIFQDERIDLSKNIAVVSLLEALRKSDINSLTFAPSVNNGDLKNLYEVMTSGKLKIKEYGDAATMLSCKGTERIRINAVKFGIQGGSAVQNAQEAQAVTRQYMEKDIIDSIRGLKDLVEKGISTLTFQEQLISLTASTEGMSDQNLQPYSEAVAKIIMGLPKEQRLDILKNAELKSFVLKVLANVDEETIKQLVVSKVEGQKQSDIGPIISAMGEDKLSTMLPELKPLVPDIYEYLAKVGLLLSEKITSNVSREDLEISIRPYYAMLDTPNAKVREEALRSLLTLATRFVKQGNDSLAEDIANRICAAIAQEAVEEIVIHVMDSIQDLYQACRERNQDKLCQLLIEPYGKMMGRPGISVHFKKAGIKFLSDTGHHTALPVLFTFLWEVGIYPDVRAAIIKFGKDAVLEALMTLKEAEDYSLRMKLVDIIKNIGSEATTILLNNLDASEWFLRRNIIAMLADIGDQDVAPKLIHLADDPDDRVRLELVRTYSKLNYEEGLEKCMNDVSQEVRAEVLRSMKKDMPREKIVELLSLFNGKGDSIHLELLKIVSEKKLPEAITPITDMLQALEARNDTTAQSLRELGVSTIIRIGGPMAKLCLEELSQAKDKMLANLASAALKRLG
ncbi:MAG TPA: HEAT repeat domain-containing protein [bacterium]